jgi:hypothetical protein
MSGALKAASWTCSTAGALIGVGSFAEHADVLWYLLAGALVILGFWLRDWKGKIESRQSEIERRVNGHGEALAALEDVPKQLAEHLREERQFQRDFYELDGFVRERLGALTGERR